MEIEAFQTGGILFSRLEIVTLVSYYGFIGVEGKNLDEVECFIQQFVDSLPETVVKIRVDGGLQFGNSDIMDVLVQYANGRGIKVIVGNYKNPSRLIYFPCSVKDL
ncbi:hypothetical protein HDU76_007540 [Blyttiomyces sp. JEL0837]|nr:hypothetical protein HDU76_007540 [Blyttiomyces sp. JEL0837]